MSSNQLVIPDRLRQLQRLEHWLQASWPLLVVLGVGGTIFRTAIVDSILSTPHPGLVYTIFGVWGATVALSAHALWRFEREAQLAGHLRSLSGKDRQAYLKNLTWKSEMGPVYDAALNPDFNQGLHVLQQKIESEMFSCEEHLLSRLDLPNYLSGSLVGIGLVGTFIGLLVSLSDLGTLLSGLMGGAGSSSDPVAMFSGMMSKLQKPMRGMGIAFLASLYGLMGSLIMGLVLNSVRKTGNQAIAKVRELLRCLAVQFSAEAGGYATIGVLNTPAAMEQLLMTMQQERAALSNGLDRFSDAIQQQSSLLDLLNHRIDTNSRQIRELDNLVAELRNFSRYMVNREKSVVSANAWLRTGAVVVVCVFISSLVTTMMAFRSSEQLTSQIPLILRSAGQQRQMPAASGSTGIDRQPASTVADVSAGSVFVVLKDDTLQRIALRYGVPLKALVAANPDVHDPDILRVGQKIRLPIRVAGSQR